MAQCKDITRFRNSVKPYQVLVKKRGRPVNITGWTFYLTVKENPNDSDQEAIINKKIDSHPEAKKGIAQFDFEPGDTNIYGVYWYSLDFKDSDGNQDVLFYGKIKFVETLRQERD